MSRLGFVLKVLASHWRRHPMQFVTLVIGLIAATALWSGVQAINAQARASYAGAAAAFGGARTPMLVARDGALLPQQAFVDLRRAGWPVSPVLEGRIVVSGRSMRLIGVEPVTLPRGGGPMQEMQPQQVSAFLAPPGRALAAPDTISDIGGAGGAALPLDNGRRLPPLQSEASLPPGVLVVDIGIAQRLLDRPGQISRLLVANPAPPPGDLPPAWRERLRFVEAGSETDLERLTDSFHINLTAFGLLSFVVGLFITHAAIGLAFEQRLPMLRTLRACGVSTGSLTIALMLELLSTALVCGLFGCLIGYAIAAALLPDVAASLRGLYGAQVPGRLTLQPSWWFASLAISALGALAAAAGSLWRVQRLPLLVSAQPQAWRAAQQRTLAWQAMLAVLILAGASVILWLGQSLIAGFGLLAALMLGAALLLPVALAALLRLGEGLAGRPLLKWFWADGRQQLPGLSLALMALLLALAVNVGVSTMVESFSRTFRGWLDNRLAAEIYLTATDAAQAREVTSFLTTRPEVTAVLVGARAETRLGDEPVEVAAFTDHATYRDRWPLLARAADVWEAVDAGEAALVSEQLARRLGLSLGDIVHLPTPRESWSLRVAAIYPDYGNPKGQVSVAIGPFARHFPDAPPVRLSLRVPPAAVATLMTELQRRFALDERHLIDQATLKAESMRIFERTFAVTASLNTLTLIVAGIALLTSLLTLSGSRLPQLAPLWAMGIGRRQLAWIELAKTLALAMFTALLALPLGLVVAWCLLAVVNVTAFGWRVPMHVFPDRLAVLFVVAVAASLVAMLLPAARLARIRPVELMKVFSDAR